MRIQNVVVHLVSQTNNKTTAVMKTTAKEYQFKSELRSDLNRAASNARYEERWSEKVQLEAMIKTLDEDYFDKLDTVNVSFMIGSRSYYQAVVKIGKAYYDGSRRMTKGRGYYCIEEIAEITDRMNADMLSDSYYY